jgi:hypothetical protein
MSITTGLRLLEAARIGIKDPDFDARMLDAMRRAHIDAFARTPGLGTQRGVGERLLAKAYREKSINAKGK